MYDARALPDPVPDEILHPEVCVIGGGPAGITTAVELGRRGHQVLLLESGGTDLDAATTALNEGEVVGYPILGGLGVPQGLDQVRYRVLGGGSNVWAGFSRPLQAADLADQPHQPLGGWPIAIGELDAHYPAAHNYCRLGPFNYDPAYWASITGLPVPAPIGDLEPRIVQLHPARFAHLYSATLSTPPITAVHHATVTRLNPSASGTRIESAEVQTLTGVRLTVTANTFVVATGGIEVPRLLLASDVTSGGIGNEHDLVGRYFADHLAAMFVFLYLRIPPEELALVSSSGHRVATQSPDGTPTEVTISGALDLSEAARSALGVPGLHLEVGSQAPDELPVQDSGIAGAQIAGLMAASPGGSPRSLAIGRCFLEAVPNAVSRVRLADTVDALGMPRVRFDWQTTSNDVANRQNAIRHVAAKVAETGAGILHDALNITTLSGAQAPATPAGYLRIVPPTGPLQVFHETTYHHMCTTRMATDPQEGVVDADCRVHSMDNLYIAGSSVFPTPVGFYPTLTIVALAVRLAAHLDAVL